MYGQADDFFRGVLDFSSGWGVLDTTRWGQWVRAPCAPTVDPPLVTLCLRFYSPKITLAFSFDAALEKSTVRAQ